MSNKIVGSDVTEYTKVFNQMKRLPKEEYGIKNH